jgi:hypothetical protein
MLTQAEVHRLFTYDPETGVFTHRYDHGRAVAGTEVGWIDANGYHRTKYRGKTFYMHKLAWLYMYGETPDLMDHWDGDPGNNRIQNLRVATRSENLANAKFPTSISGIKGVYPNTSGTKWRAMIRCGYRSYFLGDYNDVAEAEAAYREAANRLYGKFALHNRPE